MEVVFSVLLKVFVYQAEELPPDICGHGAVVWWVVPQYVSFSLPFLFGVGSCGTAVACFVICLAVF